MKPQALTGLGQGIRAAAVLFGLIACSLGSPAQAHSVALLIGNSDYQYARDLANPTSDVELVGGALSSIGFVPVVVDQNLSRDQMQEAIDRFTTLAQGADVAIIYYAGHGVEVSGINYLVPTSAPMKPLEAIDGNALRLDDVLQAAAGARLRLVFLDACRNNPSLRRLAGDDDLAIERLGLGDVVTEGETLIVYATRAGSVAEDGSGRNSPFALSVAQRIIEPGVELRMMLGHVRDDVLAATEQYQEPFVYGSLSAEPRYLAGGSPLPRPMEVAAVADPRLAELLFWQGALRIDTAAAYEEYLERFPEGQFAEQARQLAGSDPSGPAPTDEFAAFCNERVTGRYPLWKSSTHDVNAVDALELFSGEFGKFDLATIERSLLAGHPDTGAESFSRYLKLREFIDRGVRLQVQLESLADGYDEVEFEVGGSSYRWRRGETEAVPFYWTLSGRPTAALRLYRNGQRMETWTAEGTWSLFRLIEHAGERQNVGPHMIRADFGHDAVSFRIDLPAINPFGSGEAWAFRCPGGEQGDL